VFPVYSTSVQTAAIKRLNRVMQRAKVSPKIDHAGVYNCRRINGSSSWSQHSFGNASDLFPKGSTYLAKKENCKRIAGAVVYQATHRTKANRFRKLKVSEVIDHENRRMWTPLSGWRPYSGSTGLHVHVSGAPKKYGTPGCA
jgi:hypothetical protein